MNVSGSSGGGGLQNELNDAIAHMEELKVIDLKSICKAIELPTTGRKAILQDRIRIYLKNSLSVGRIDPWRPKAIRILIDKVLLGNELPKYETLWLALKTGAYKHPVATGKQAPSTLQKINTQAVNRLETHKLTSLNRNSWESEASFLASPFYKLKKEIEEARTKINIQNGRGVAIAKFNLLPQEWSLLNSDKKYKLYLFGKLHKPYQSDENSDPIQFPHPNEIRFNSVQIKDNVRGLKNKPGTAKPADLTEYAKQSNFQNVLEIVYAFTKEEYRTFAYLVELITPEEILQDVLKHPKIIKLATLNYIKRTLSEEEDEDLMTTSTVMSLQCPVSYTRMKYPAKSINCRHLQCFDALWYIYSQMQVPTWQCPVCQIPVKIETMAVCEYVDDILKASSEDVEQVELSSDGSWVPLDEDGNKLDKNKVGIKPNKDSSIDVHQDIKRENSNDINNTIPVDSNTSVSSDIASNNTMVISLDSDDDDEDIPLQPQTRQALPPPPPLPFPQLDNTENQIGVGYDNENSDEEEDDEALTAHSITTAANSSTCNAIKHNTQRRYDMNGAINSVSSSIHTKNVVIPRGISIDSTDSSTQLTGLISDTATMSNDNINTATNSTTAISHSSTETAFIMNPATGLPDISLKNTNNMGTESSIFLSLLEMPPTATPPSILNNNNINISGGSILGLNSQPFLTNTNPQSNPNPTEINTTNSNFTNNILGISGEISSITPTDDVIGTSPQGQQLRLPSLNQSRGSGISRGTFSSDPIIHSRGRRNIVSPFIPKKPYLNMLPQKRQHVVDHNGSNSQMQTGTSFSSHTNAVPVLQNIQQHINRTIDGKRNEELDVIDLTSDH